MALPPIAKLTPDCWHYLLKYHLGVEVFPQLYRLSRDFNKFFWGIRTDLTFTKINDTTLGLYVNKPGVKLTQNVLSISIPDTPQLTDNGLTLIAKFANLRTLNLSSYTLTHEGLKHIAALPLVKLAISTCVNDEGLALLAGIPSLVTLSLSNAEITGSGLFGFTSASQLKALSLVSCPTFSDDGMEVIQTMTNLTSLNISHCVSISAPVWGKLSSLTNLIKLSLISCKNLSTDGFRALADMHDLDFLEVSYCYSAPHSVISNLSGLTRLRTVNFGQFRNFNNKALLILSGVPSLTSLDISSTGVKLMKDEDLQMIKKLYHLTSLHAHGITVSEEVKIGLSRIYNLTFTQSKTKLNLHKFKSF